MFWKGLSAVVHLGYGREGWKRRKGRKEGRRKGSIVRGEGDSKSEEERRKVEWKEEGKNEKRRGYRSRGKRKE